MNKTLATSAAILAILFVLLSHAFSQARAGGFIGIAFIDAPNSAGALVGMVKPGGPADKAGVELGDRIVAVNGSGVDRAATIIGIIGSMVPNQVAHLSVIRGRAGLAHRCLIDVVLSSLDGTSGSGTSAPVSAVPSRSTPGPGVDAKLDAPARPLAVSGFARLTDPLEQAFTVEVPSGWRSETGLARRSALQINPYVRSLSPDKMTYLMIGEPTMPSFTPPSQMGNAIGYRQGKLYDAGLGGLALVMHYMSGPEFTRAYGETVLQGMCPSFRYSSAQQRPDLARAADALLPTVIPSRSDGGEARFSCMHNRQEMEVRVEAVTRITRDNVGWSVIFLQAFISPKGQAGNAEDTLKHIVASIKFTDAWIRKQNSLSQEAARQINLRMQEMFRQEQAFMQKLNSVDENFESVDELISGFSTYHDERTGNNYSMSNTNPTKWIDDSTGRIISTATDSKPLWAASYRLLPRGSQ
jgi:hypothetical protein